MNPLRIVVLGTIASNPYAGMAWMHMQIAGGLQRLGHDVYYFELTSTWPYDPLRNTKVDDSNYAVPYLARVSESFGLRDRWAYRQSYSDKKWLGLSDTRAEEILATADLVLNVAGATRVAEEGLKTGRLIYFGTDPVIHEIGYANGDPDVISIIDEHAACVTYGENIGTQNSPIPPLPRLLGRLRQPVLMDVWAHPSRTRPEFTTVANWEQSGRDVRFAGEDYHWSKHYEFLKIIDLPARIAQPIELALNLDTRATPLAAEGEAVPAQGLPLTARDVLEARGWSLKNALQFTMDPWTYRDYIRESRGELTVARDLNVRLRSGWFSERSACYLAAGRPVVTQDTGFGTVLPTGRGLFAFNNIDEAQAGIEAINADYELHSRAASEIAEEYFRAEVVLSRFLLDVGSVDDITPHKAEPHKIET